MASFDPYDPEQFKRLRKAVKSNYRALEPFRNVRELVAEAARGHYYNSKDSNLTARRDTVNLIDQWMQTLVRSFVQSVPRARITSRSDPRAARAFQEHVNKVVVEIDILNTLRRAVQEALLGYMGVAYCGIAPTDLDQAGESFVDSIPLPDFVMDISHSEFEQADLVGHRFYRRIVDLQESGMYDPEQVEKLTSRNYSISELDGKRNKRFGADDATLFDWTDLWAVKVNAANLIVYYSESDTTDKPLRVESFDGPDFGPYVFLAFDRVLDEMMPNSRGALMLDMHEFSNSQYRRVFMKEDQAAEVWTYEGGAEEDARRIKNAFDGEFIRVDNTKAVNRILKGGTNPQALATAIHSRQLFDEFSGNVRRTGGVGSQADTATQARLDNANTSRLVRDMQLQVIAFTKKIFQNIAWYEWTHPTRTRQIEVKIGKNGNAIQDLWSPEMRDGDFIQFDIDIVPDSFEHRTSRQQLDELMKAVQGVVMPLMQVPSARPVTLKVPEFLEKYSELANLPELAEVADYALDDSFVSQPSGGGQSRIPAGATATGQQAGGAREAGGGSSDEAFVQRVLSGAVSGNGQGDQSQS